MSDPDYDYVIVGGGSAGCVLANRLSADPNQRVLVLEAGRPDAWWDVFIHMPAALAFPLGSRFYDWGYLSDPEPHMNDREVYHARGKLLGGSSSINGMIFQRGNRADYDGWATQAGNEWKRRQMATTAIAGAKAPYRLNAGAPKVPSSTHSLKRRSRPVTGSPKT